MDFDSIPYGVDFRDKIKQTLEGAQVVVAVIGPGWAGNRGRGKRRIDEATDFVRLEITQALLRGIPVIPVLLDNTPMPKAETLPDDLRGLAYRNALTLDTGVDFHHHANRLIAGIRDLVVIPVKPSHVEQPATIADDSTPVPHPPISTPEQVSGNDQHERTKLMLRGSLGLLALVTLFAIWNLLFWGSGPTERRKYSDTTPNTTPSEAPKIRDFPSATPSPSLSPTFSQITTPVTLATTPAEPLTPSPSPTPTATETPSLINPAVLVPSAAVSASTPSTLLEVITEQESEALINSFYRAVSRKDMSYILSLFDESVDYHTDGQKGKAAIKDDYTRYFKRWPVASFKVGKVRIRRSTQPNNVVLVFDIGFAVRDPASRRSKTGRAEEEWILQRIRGIPKIVTQHETVYSDSSQPRARRK